MNKVSEYITILKAQLKIRKQKDFKIDKTLTDKLAQCPCSTKYHGAYPGGLVDHLLNVTNLSYRLSHLFTLSINDRSSLMFCSLIHDLGKLGNCDSDLYLPNPDSNTREKVPFIANTSLISIPHETRTLYWLDRMNIHGLTEDELQAICYHAGPYKSGYMDSIRKESNLLVLLHSADNLATKIIER